MRPRGAVPCHRGMHVPGQSEVSLTCQRQVSRVVAHGLGQTEVAQGPRADAVQSKPKLEWHSNGEIQSRGRWFSSVPVGTKGDREPRGNEVILRQAGDSPAMGDHGRVEDTHGFLFLWNSTFNTARQRKTLSHSHKSSSASPMTMAIKAPPQCHQRGQVTGLCKPPLALPGTLFSQTRSQKCRLAMGNGIFK